MSEGVLIAEAAIAMGEKPATVWRWVRDHNAPVVRRGRKGRGNSTLVDPAALDAWRNAQRCEQQLLALANELPELLADAVYATACDLDGPDKRRVCGVLAVAWYRSSVAVLDRIRVDAPVPELASVPEKITRLRLIFDDSDTFGS